MKIDAINLLLGSMSILATTLLGVLGFMVRKWTDRVDQGLSRLSGKIEEASLKLAVMESRESASMGTVAALRDAQMGLTKDVGKLTASVDRAWEILVENEMALPRPPKLKSS